jgi:hypothetical protein
LHPEELVAKILHFIKNFGPYGNITDVSCKEKKHNLPWMYVESAGIPKGTKKLLFSKPFFFVKEKIDGIDNKIADDIYFYTNLDSLFLDVSFV